MESLKFIAAVCIFLVLVFTVILLPIIGLASASCRSQATQMEAEYSWGLLQDCMIKVDGKWILLNNYKVVKVRPN